MRAKPGCWWTNGSGERWPAGPQGDHEEGPERKEELAEILGQTAGLGSEAEPAAKCCGGNLRQTKHQFYGNYFPPNWPPS